MFSWFRKKDPAIKISSTVFMNEAGKWNACREILASQPSTVFVAWFEATKHAFEKNVSSAASTQIKFADRLNAFDLSIGPLIFIEHHLSYKREQETFKNLNLQSPTVYCSLDEGILQVFGGENIQKLMKMLGGNVNEGIHHPMIDQSIVNAQRKIESKINNEQFASSQKEWLQRNVTDHLL